MVILVNTTPAKHQHVNYVNMFAIEAFCLKHHRAASMAVEHGCATRKCFVIFDI